MGLDARLGSRGRHRRTASRPSASRPATRPRAWTPTRASCSCPTAPTGVPLAVLNASAVTEIRTAAMSVLATELLARPGAGDLAVIGTGVQARAHMRAFSATRLAAPGPGRRAGRRPGRPRSRPPLQAEVDAVITACASAAEAVAGRGHHRHRHHLGPAGAAPRLDRRRRARQRGRRLPARRHAGAGQRADGRGAAVYCDSREGLPPSPATTWLAEAEGLIARADVARHAGRGAGRTGRRAVATTARSPCSSRSGLAVEDLAAARPPTRPPWQTGAGQWLTF